MNYRHKLAYVLVRKTGLSFDLIHRYLAEGDVQVNGEICRDNKLVSAYDAILCKDNWIQNPEEYRYIVFNKPIGIECTLHPENADGLLRQLPEELQGLNPAGRLDKNSEGLLLLTNDGNVLNRITRPDKGVVKTYHVILESKVTDDFLKKMRTGVPILNTITLPCEIKQLGDFEIEIQLTQGLNRQIRRMAFACNNYVTALRRTQIGKIVLGNLEPGKWRALNATELNWLREI